MLYGMTYEQFWFGDPWMVRAYAQCYLLKRRLKNEELWLEGIYTANAFQTVLGNAFGKKKLEYLKQPLDIYEKTEAEKKQEIRQERMKLVEFLSKMKQSADKKGVEQDGKP